MVSFGEADDPFGNTMPHDMSDISEIQSDLSPEKKEMLLKVKSR